jgi:hypothetical protein
MSSSTTTCFKTSVFSFKTQVFGASADPRHLGVFILTRVIPGMDKGGEIAFSWHEPTRDITSYTQETYDEAILLLKAQGCECVKGESVYHYDFTGAGGKKRRCILTTEIYFIKGKRHRISPVAYLFAQFFGEGIHITKCTFGDAPKS